MGRTAIPGKIHLTVASRNLAQLFATLSYLTRLTGHVQLGEFCKKVAEIDSRINTVIVIKETELEGDTPSLGSGCRTWRSWRGY